MRKFPLALAAIAVCLGFVACDDDEESFAAISGKISENVVSLKGGVTYLGGINVELYKGEAKKTQVGTTKTAADGSYAFSNLTRGQYEVHYRANEDAYAPVDTIINIFDLQPYKIDVKLHYNLERGNGEWISNDNVLTMRLWDGMFTIYRRGGSQSDPFFRGQYNVNKNATQLAFVDYDSNKSFDADYIGEGALYVFLPQEVEGKNRYIFYKDK